MKSSTEKKDKEFSKELILACNRYAKVLAKGERCAWKQAAEAYRLKEVGELKKEPYLIAAEAVCGVTKGSISQRIKAEEIRRKLNFDADKLPINSMYAMYELHRGAEAARAVSGGDQAALKQVEEKITETGQAIAAGRISVRGVRNVFGSERKKLKDVKRPVGSGFKIGPPRIETLNAAGFKEKIEKICVPADQPIPILTISPAKGTARAVRACLADIKNQKAIANACPKRGFLCVLIDLTEIKKENAQKKTPEPIKKPKARKGPREKAA